MKINCGLSRITKHLLKEDWHPYFCWWPVRIGDYDCCWLEWIERKGRYIDDTGCWIYSYRRKGVMIEN